MTKLSINLNKVALLRNQRDIGYPSVLGAARAVIAAGVCVGDDAVVCPGSVVIKDVGEAMIVAGSPACVTGNAAFDCVR